MRNGDSEPCRAENTRSHHYVRLAPHCGRDDTNSRLWELVGWYPAARAKSRLRLKPGILFRSRQCA